ncbi:MAG: hypothetical protein U0792_21945 [Gemmataceae bacterium]
MPTMRCLVGSVTFLLAAVAVSSGAQPPTPQPRKKTPAIVDTPASPTAGRMPLTGLTPAKPMFDACVYRYGIGTSSKQCQAFVDQALGMYYSYVWIEAARAAETALSHDPECAYAWLVLHRSLEKWGKGSAAPKTAALRGVLGVPAFSTLSDKDTKSPIDYTLEMARKLMPNASHREQLSFNRGCKRRGCCRASAPMNGRKRPSSRLMNC